MTRTPEQETRRADRGALVAALEGAGGEEWRAVVGYESLYQVSNLGRIKGRVRDRWSSRLHEWRLLSPRPHGDGYLTVLLHKDRRGTNAKIHALVAYAFIGPCPAGHEVNHIDTFKSHNWASNLEYVTHPENMRHAYAHGLIPDRTGERNANAKISDEQAEEIKRRSAAGETRKSVADSFGLTPGYVSKIALGRSRR